MNISREQRIKDFSKLGCVLTNYISNKTDEYNYLIDKAILTACIQNKWFTKHTCCKAIEGISLWLKEKDLSKWISNYVIPDTKVIAILMAGNIPMVGFHDLLSVIILGQKAIVKPSEKDSALINVLIEILYRINPSYKEFITTVLHLKGQSYDAVIATGSGTASNYFKHYFGNKPSIIRGHKNAIAILDGNESEQDLGNLGKDIFDHYGLGCRNVTKIYLPKGYDFDRLEVLGRNFTFYTEHNKYMNNYQYYKTIFALNAEKYLDYHFYILRPHKDIHAFPSIIHYEFYDSLHELKKEINNQKELIQCISSSIPTIKSIPFGQAQTPKVNQYANQINTLTFIKSLFA